jgi:hypothetical protein
LQRILNEFCSENVNFQEIGEGPMSQENMSFERARAGDLRAWLGAGGGKKSWGNSGTKRKRSFFVIEAVRRKVTLVLAGVYFRVFIIFLLPFERSKN